MLDSCFHYFHQNVIHVFKIQDLDRLIRMASQETQKKQIHQHYTLIGKHRKGIMIAFNIMLHVKTQTILNYMTKILVPPMKPMQCYHFGLERFAILLLLQ